MLCDGRLLCVPHVACILVFFNPRFQVPLFPNIHLTTLGAPAPWGGVLHLGEQCAESQAWFEDNLQVELLTELYFHPCTLVWFSNIIGYCNHVTRRTDTCWKNCNERSEVCVSINLLESSTRTTVPRLRLIEWHCDTLHGPSSGIADSEGQGHCTRLHFSHSSWCPPWQKLKHYNGRRDYVPVTEHQLHELKDRSQLLWKCCHLI